AGPYWFRSEEPRRAGEKPGNVGNQVGGAASDGSEFERQNRVSDRSVGNIYRINRKPRTGCKLANSRPHEKGNGPQKAQWRSQKGTREVVFGLFGLLLCILCNVPDFFGKAPVTADAGPHRDLPKLLTETHT